MSQKIVMNFLAHVLPFFLLIHFSLGLYEIEVHRMLGYEEGDRWLGSKVQSFTMVAAHYAGESLRKLAMIQFSEIDESSLEHLFQKKPGGILIILPNSFEQKDKETQIWKLIYEFIGPKVENMPVYFCWESQQVLRLYQQKKEKRIDENSFEVQFQVSGAEPRQVTQLSFEDIYSSFDDVTNVRQNNPTFMVVVGADSNLPSAEMTVPLENEGFQLELYFSLVKSLKHVYLTYQRRDQNILFYFSTTNSLNYEGIKKFFSKSENQRIVNSIENILILESIHSNGPFYLEVQASSFSTQNEKLSNILKIFKQSFVEQGLAVSERDNSNLILKTKDVNVLKLTSSDNQYYQSFLSPQTRQSFNLVKMHNAVFQALLKIAYGINQNFTETRTYDELIEQDQDDNFIQGIYDFFNSSNRHVTNIQRDSKFSLELTKVFNGLFKNSQKSTYVYKERKYYMSQPTKANILKFISAFLDLYFFVGVITWLGLMFVLFKNFNIIPSQDNDQIKQSKKIR